MYQVSTLYGKQERFYKDFSIVGQKVPLPLNNSKKPAWNRVKSGIFLLTPSQGKGLKILTPKQMLQRLPIALAQI